jgi:hypothetical protein
MAIPHIQERLQLVALRKQSHALFDEQEQTFDSLTDRDALKAAGIAFSERWRAISRAEKEIEQAIGGALQSGTCGDGVDYCAITGLPILTSDKVAAVLVEALPVSAAALLSDLA